jgi:hypothetical protein
VRFNDTPGSFAVVGGNVGSVNRKQCLTKAGTLINAKYNLTSHYVTRTVATKLKIGIDAFDDGRLRVHVYSDEPGRAAQLAKRPAKPGPLPAVATAKGRPGIRGQRHYYGFEWTATGSDYASEYDRITTFVKWLKAEFASSKP